MKCEYLNKPIYGEAYCYYGLKKLKDTKNGGVYERTVEQILVSVCYKPWHFYSKHHLNMWTRRLLFIMGFRNDK